MRSFECFLKAGAGEQSEISISLPPEQGAILAGTVSDEAGQPLPDALVLLFQQESGKLLAHTATDGDGRFWFGSLTPDTLYKVRIQKDDMHIRVVELQI